MNVDHSQAFASRQPNPKFDIKLYCDDYAHDVSREVVWDWLWEYKYKGSKIDVTKTITDVNGISFQGALTESSAPLLSNPSVFGKVIDPMHYFGADKYAYSKNTEHWRLQTASSISI